MSSRSPFGRTARPRRLGHPDNASRGRPTYVGLALALFAWGCGGAAATDNTQTTVDLVGVWKLRSVGGVSLPYDIPSTAGRTPGDKYQLYYGSLEFSAGVANYGFRDSTRYTSPGGFASVNVNGDDGFVTRGGATLTLRSGRTAATVTATVVGTSLHATRDAVDYVYTR